MLSLDLHSYMKIGKEILYFQAYETKEIHTINYTRKDVNPCIALKNPQGLKVYFDIGLYHLFDVLKN